MRLVRIPVHLVLTIALALAAAQAAGEHHEAAAEESDRQPWDQQKMTDLTERLARAMRDVRRAYRREPAFAEPHNPNRRAATRMAEILQALDSSCTQLRNRVRDGGGFEETRGIARKIGSLLNDADVEGRRIMTSVWMNEKLRPTMELINEIAPFYGSDPLYDPDTLQRVDRPPRHDRTPPQE